MLFPVDASWTLSAGYNQRRPLSMPEDQRWHIHAAWDIAAPTGTHILAPENGRLQYFMALRNSAKRTMGELEMPQTIFDICGHHYFYDVYGAVIFLVGASGMSHVFAHSWLNQVWKQPQLWNYTESKKLERYPIACWYSSIGTAQRGEVVGRIGSAGFSTGPHIHYEIHPGRRWRTYDERINPGTVYRDLAGRDTS